MKSFSEKKSYLSKNIKCLQFDKQIINKVILLKTDLKDKILCIMMMQNEKLSNAKTTIKNRLEIFFSFLRVDLTLSQNLDLSGSGSGSETD